MAKKSFFQNIFKRAPAKKAQMYTAMLNNAIPLFSQFGKDIYKSDIVKWAVRAIANEIKKAEIAVVDKDFNLVKTTLNSIFSCAPNNLMVMSDFLEKIVWLYYKNNNVYIYSHYKIVNDRKVYTSIYPLNPINVEFYQYDDGEISIVFYFENNESFELNYSEIIHLRRDFSENELVGGDKYGKPDTDDTLRNIQLNEKLTNSLCQSIESSMAIKGFIHAKGALDADKLERERERFEEQLKKAQKGFVPIDLAVDITPFECNPKLIDKDTLEFIEKKVLRNYGTSIAIIDGDYTDEQFEAFYQKALEPFFVMLQQTFMKVLLTDEEKRNGYKIKVYDKLVQHASMKTKIQLVKEAAPIGSFRRNEIRELFGYLPVENGQEIPMSLNWINSTIADEYQLKKLGGDKNE